MMPSARLSATAAPSWSVGGALRDTKNSQAAGDTPTESVTVTAAPVPAPVVDAKPARPKPSFGGSLKASSGPPPRSKSRGTKESEVTNAPDEPEPQQAPSAPSNSVEDNGTSADEPVNQFSGEEPASPIVVKHTETEDDNESSQDGSKSAKPKAPPVNPLKNVKVKLNMPDGSFSTVLIGPQCTVAEVCGTVAFRRGYNPLVLYTIYSVEDPKGGTKTVTELKPGRTELLQILRDAQKSHLEIEVRELFDKDEQLQAEKEGYQISDR
jgi:hypothetical protein